MKKIIRITITVALVVMVLGILFVVIFPENKRSRVFGTEMKIEVEPGQKVMMATFKGDNLFYMTEPMEPGYSPKTKTLREKSGRGIIEATVKFIETDGKGIDTK